MSEAHITKDVILDSLNAREEQTEAMVKFKEKDLEEAKRTHSLASQAVEVYIIGRDKPKLSPEIVVTDEI